MTAAPPIDTATVEPIAVDAEAAGALFGCCERTWRTMDTEGTIPAPLRLRGCVRWYLIELREWAAVGCPSRLEWERWKDARMSNEA